MLKLFNILQIFRIFNFLIPCTDKNLFPLASSFRPPALLIGETYINIFNYLYMLNRYPSNATINVYMAVTENE